MEARKYQVGDIVRMKKSHPCGSDTWEILRTGMISASNVRDAATSS